MSSYFSKVRDRNGQITHIISENNFIRLTYCINDGIVDVGLNINFQEYCFKHNSIYIMRYLQDEVTRMLSIKFERNPLIFNDQMINIIDMEIDMVILKYIHQFDVVCRYNLEISNEK